MEARDPRKGPRSTFESSFIWLAGHSERIQAGALGQEQGPQVLFDLLVLEMESAESPVSDTVRSLASHPELLTPGKDSSVKKTI